MRSSSCKISPHRKVSMSSLFLLALALLVSSATLSEAFIEGIFNFVKVASSPLEDYGSEEEFQNHALKSTQTVVTKIAIFNNHTQQFPAITFNSSELLTQGFKLNLPVKFIVHGFHDSSDSVWVKDLARALLLADNFNVFIVDWAIAASRPYRQATEYTRVVAKELEKFIQFLKVQLGVNAVNIHCIGHSLGCQVCGHTGQQMDDELGRITALDPAGPASGFILAPSEDRLDSSDARFVDVIHTDITGFGTRQPCGHVDFYPNNGMQQPGCPRGVAVKDKDQWAQIKNISERESIACNHRSSIDFFIESLYSYNKSVECRFVGHVCTSYNDYTQGTCGSCKSDNSNCAIMGLEAEQFPIGSSTKVQLYLSTSNRNSSCAQHHPRNIPSSRPSNESVPSGGLESVSKKISDTGDEL